MIGRCSLASHKASRIFEDFRPHAKPPLIGQIVDEIGSDSIPTRVSSGADRAAIGLVGVVGLDDRRRVFAQVQAEKSSGEDRVPPRVPVGPSRGPATPYSVSFTLSDGETASAYSTSGSKSVSARAELM